MRKHIITLILVLLVVLSLPIAAYAASDKANDSANSLHNMGLFQGTGTDASGNPVYELDRAPNRTEALVMLVRLLGKEDDALSGTWNTPFTDVPEWAEPYVGYAYNHRLTKGTGLTTFGSYDPACANHYLTFVLRSLGYVDGTDFEWDTPWTLSDKIGLTNGEYNAETKAFTRGDVVIISNDALSIKINGSEKTLHQSLVDSGDIKTRQCSNIEFDSNGNLILTMDDGTVINAGSFTGLNGKDGKNGSDGRDGVSVVDASINEDGELILELSNGNTINAGKVSYDGSGKTFDDYEVGTVFDIYPNKEFDWPLVINDGLIGTDNFGGPFTGQTYTVHVNSMYYTLTAKNDISDQSKYYYDENNGYQYIPYEFIVSIRAYTDPELAGSYIYFHFRSDVGSGFTYSGQVGQDGLISIDYKNRRSSDDYDGYVWTVPVNMSFNHMYFRYCCNGNHKFVDNYLSEYTSNTNLYHCCSECGTSEKHNYDENHVCTECGHKCEHNYEIVGNMHICKFCGDEHEYNFLPLGDAAHYCTICDRKGAHNYINSICTLCKYECTN